VPSFTLLSLDASHSTLLNVTTYDVSGLAFDIFTLDLTPPLVQETSFFANLFSYIFFGLVTLIFFFFFYHGPLSSFLSHSRMISMKLGLSYATEDDIISGEDDDDQSQSSQSSERDSSSEQEDSSDNDTINP
jgi:hypothetical protein